MTKYEDKFASLGQVNSLNSWDKFQICCKDMCLIRFLLNFAVFCEFLWISRLRYCSKYQKPCTYELRHLHITNWRLKICIWRLHFSSWLPKGDLKIFLISSPAYIVFIVAVPFLHIPFTIIWACMEVGRRKLMSLQLVLKCFHSLGPPANGKERNTQTSWFLPNLNLTGTILSLICNSEKF